MDHLEPFLAIVRAISWDGGDAVLAALEAVLRDEAPYDAGEVVTLGPIGFERCLFSPESVVAEDMLLAARRRGGHWKLDDIRDHTEFPRTRELMERSGLRSLLLLSLSEAGGLEGWVSLARSSAYGFAGVSFRFLGPIASIAGLALQKSRSLSKLHKKLPILGDVSPFTPPGGERVPQKALGAAETAAPEADSTEPAALEPEHATGFAPEPEVLPAAQETPLAERPSFDPHVPEPEGPSPESMVKLEAFVPTAGSTEEAASLDPHVQGPNTRSPDATVKLEALALPETSGPEHIDPKPAAAEGDHEIPPDGGAGPKHETRAERRARKRAERDRARLAETPSLPPPPRDGES